MTSIRKSKIYTNFYVFSFENIGANDADKTLVPHGNYMMPLFQDVKLCTK